MYLLAASILLSTILYLVDKNQAWGKFWRALRWGTVAAVVCVALVIGYSKYAEHKAAAHASEWQDYVPSDPHR